MFKLNGEFIMQGCDPSDPNCLHTISDLIRLIEQMGFLPLFANIIPGFSVEEKTTAEVWEGEDSPWEWREILAAHPDIAYGRFFDGKTGFIHRSWFPTFANYRRNGCDFEDLYYEGHTPHSCKKVMEQIRGLIVPNGELKRQSGIGDGYNAAMTLLQMHTYLIACGFERKVNKRGQISGSWHEAIFSTPETKWDYDFVTAEYGDDPSDSWEKILEQLRRNYPSVDDKSVFKLLGITIGDVAIGKPVKKAQPKQEPKTILSNQLPWPESIITEIGLKDVFGVDEYATLSEDQLKGLDYALRLITPKEREVLFLRYKEHLSLRQIGKHYERCVERIRQINNKAIRKLRHPSRLKYYRDGFQNSQRIEREHAEILKAQVAAIRKENKAQAIESLKGLYIEEMNLSVRAYNCLSRAGIREISELERIINTEPQKLMKTRNLGKHGLTEILDKAELYGIDTELARKICKIDLGI